MHSFVPGTTWSQLLEPPPIPTQSAPGGVVSTKILVAVSRADLERARMFTVLDERIEVI